MVAPVDLSAVTESVQADAHRASALLDVVPLAAPDRLAAMNPALGQAQGPSELSVLVNGVPTPAEPCAPREATAEVHDYHDIGTGVLAASVAKRAPGYLSLGFPRPTIRKDTRLTTTSQTTRS